MIPPKMTSKNLRELDLRANYNVNAIAIVNNENLIISPSPEQVLHAGDKLVVIGHRDDINEFANIE